MGGLLLLGLALPAGAAIDTAWLEGSWPRQSARELEVGKYPVRWRQAIDRQRGLLAGVRFTAPLSQQAAWASAQDYHDVGRGTPGVDAVRFLEDTPERQLIELDITVLWKRIALRFEVEREAPRRLRFQLLPNPYGDYMGYCTFAPGPEGTVIDLATCLKPARPVPGRLLLLAERLALLGGVRSFLKDCERQAR